MAEVWKPKDPNILRDWLKAIAFEASDSLTSWETGFIDSIEQRLDRGFRLTQAQEETLERIYSEKTA